MNSDQTKPRYIAYPVRRTDDGKGVERVYPPYSDQSINDIIKWSVYECQQDGELIPIADFTGEEDADNAKAFANYKNEETTREYCKQIRMQVQKIVRRTAGTKHPEDVYWAASAALPVRSAIRELAKYFHNQLEVYHETNDSNRF